MLFTESSNWLLQFFGVRGLLLPHITSAAAALTTFGRRTDGPSFPLSFTVLWGLLALRLFLSPFVGSLGCFPRSKKEGRGSEKRKLMLSAREPGRIYLERKREDLVRATTRHGSPWTCLQPLGFPSAIWIRVRVIRRR